MPYNKFSALIFIIALFLTSGCNSGRRGYVDQDNWQEQFPQNNNIDYNIVDITPNVVTNMLARERNILGHCYDSAFERANAPSSYALQPGDKVFIKLAVINTGFPSELVDNTDLVHILPQPHKSKDEASFNIDSEGNITIPYAGSIHIAGQTPAQAKDTLTKEFKVYFRQPFVEVKVFQYNSQYASISGEVNNIRNVKLSEDKLTILKIIEQAAGVKETADLHSSTITKKDGTVLNVNLFELLENGDQSQNFVLEDGDHLNIPYTDGNKIFLTGEVVDRKVINLESGKVSLTEALIEGNGAHHFAGDESRVYIVRGTNFEKYKQLSKKNRCYYDSQVSYANYDGKTGITVYAIDLSNPQTMALADQFMLKPRDILYVGTREITQWNRFITQLLPENFLQGLTLPGTL